MSSEDIILYTLNGLPPIYQAFKTAIRTNLQPLSLDDFYALLCSEELNLQQDFVQAVAIPIQSNQQFALYTRG